MQSNIQDTVMHSDCHSTAADAPVRGRLAPSPTGYMHLGNIWSFLLCWLHVRRCEGRLVLRMEDIDPDRSRPEFEVGIMRDLQWLGIDWDEGPDTGGPYAPYRQSERLARYQQVLDEFARRGFVYPCYCTRKELRAMASAPHKDDQTPVYPGLCLHLSPEERAEKEKSGRKPALRLQCDADAMPFSDLVLGDICMDLTECGGDFPLRRSDGVFAYQLAVVVDDIDQRITHIVRGDDILDSTPRQLLLYKRMEATPPVYAHVPLIFDYEGERLAKRHKHYEIRAFRDNGVAPEAIIGFLAYHAGLIGAPARVSAAELVSSFSFDALQKAKIKHTARDRDMRGIVLEKDVEAILLSL